MPLGWVQPAISGEANDGSRWLVGSFTLTMVAVEGSAPGGESALHLPGHPAVAASILKVLHDAGGSQHRSQVYLPVGTRLGLSGPQLSKQTASGREAWKVRVNFSRLYLANAGLLKSIGGGVWTLTPAGREAALSQDSVKAVKLAYKANWIPRRIRPSKQAERTGAKVVEAANHERLAEGPGSLAALAALTENPERFEEAVARTFQTLGLDATHVGGSGETDVLVTAHRANPPYSVVVDAKTTTREKVGSQIHWYNIERHRVARSADYGAVVAVGFRGGVITEQAVKDKVSLITPNALQTVLTLHRTAPFSQEELRILFVPQGDGSPDLKSLEAIASMRSERTDLLQAMIRAADEYLADVESVAPEALYGFLKARFADYGLAKTPALAEIRVAVEFLANDFLGILERESAERYRMAMTAATSRERLAAVLQSER